MIDRRTRLAGALTTLCIAGLGGAVLLPTPSIADPSITDVRASVDRLYHEAEQASERYNDARLRLQEAKANLAALREDLDRQLEAVEERRDEVAAAVVADYQGQTLTTAGQVVLANDPDAFLSRLATISEHNAQRGSLVEELALEVERLELREALAEREVAVIEESEAALAAEKAIIDEKAEEAEALLGRMEEERELRVSRSAPRPPATPAAAAPASGRAAAAVNYALAQVGDAYVWGAMGPNAFDCSGLTSAAWAQAGVSLPHSSSAQMAYGPRVSSSALQPGDLVFYYSPVSHVGIYIGNGQIVHAANPSTGVRVAPVFSMPFSGAVRPG